MEHILFLFYGTKLAVGNKLDVFGALTFIPHVLVYENCLDFRDDTLSQEEAISVISKGSGWDISHK